MKLQRYFDSYPEQSRAHASNYRRFGSNSEQPQNLVHNRHIDAHTFLFSIYFNVRTPNSEGLCLTASTGR